MRFGRIYRGLVVSVTEPPLGRTIEEHVGASQAEFYTEIPDHVDVDYKQNFDGTWQAPKPIAA